MRHIFPIGLLPVFILFPSCNPSGMTVTDHSFSFSARYSFDEASLRSRISLVMDSGERESDYTVTYVIDDDEELLLSLSDGTAQPRKLSVSFEDFPTATWLLPTLPEGQHEIDFVISNGSYSQELRHPFEVTAEPFLLHAEVLTDGISAVSTLLINLLDGIADRHYSGMVYLDGIAVSDEGFEVNFRDTPTLMIGLPATRPGEHTVAIDISDGRRSHQQSLRYDEPLRHPDLSILISHDDLSGRTRLMVPENPYGLHMAVSDSLHVKGKCTYTIAYGTCSTRTETEYMEVAEGVTLELFVPEDGRYYDLVDKDYIEGKVTGEGRQSTVWTEVWRTDSEGYWDYEQEDGPFVHFSIVSSIQEINVSIEPMSGVTVHVRCTEPGCLLNGTALGQDTYSFML